MTTEMTQELNLRIYLIKLKFHPISEEKKGWSKSKLVDITNQYLVSPTPQSKLLFKDHLTAFWSLKRNNDVMIPRPDKCSGVVLMKTQ